MEQVLGAVRLSRLTEESTSPARQRERIEWWTGGQDAELVHVCEDLDVSGAVDPFERASLGQWLSDQPPQEWDTLVAWKLDRISRSSMDTERLLRWCLDRDKRIVAVDDGIDTSTQMGQVWVKLASIFAEVERNAIKERTAKGKAKLRETGRWSGEAVHYGFKVEDRGSGWYLIHDEPAVAVIRDVVRRIMDGASVGAVAEYLTEQGVKTPRDRQRELRGKPVQGKPWNPQTLSKLLASRTLLGYTTYKGEPDPEVLKAEPILTTREFQDLQKVLDKRRFKHRTHRTQKTSPLLGVAFCAECLSQMYQRSQTINGKPYRYYYCGNKHGQSVRADELEQILEDELRNQIGDVEIYEDVYVPGTGAAEDLEAAVFALDELTDAMGRASSRTARERLSERISALDKRIADLEALPHEPARTERRPTGQTYGEALEGYDLEQRRTLLQRLGVSVRVLLTGKGRGPGQGGVFRFELDVPSEILERLRGGEAS